MLCARWIMLWAIVERAATMKVGIVGGGVSGVAAARRLAQHGVKSVIYERNDVLGGRLGSLSMPGPKAKSGSVGFLTLPPLWSSRAPKTRIS